MHQNSGEAAGNSGGKYHVAKSRLELSPTVLLSFLDGIVERILIASGCGNRFLVPKIPLFFLAILESCVLKISLIWLRLENVLLLFCCAFFPTYPGCAPSARGGSWSQWASHMAPTLSMGTGPVPICLFQILLTSVGSFAVRCRPNATFWCVSLTSVNQRLRKQSGVPEMASAFEKHFIAMTLNPYPGIVSGLVMQQGAAFGCFV